MVMSGDQGPSPPRSHPAGGVLHGVGRGEHTEPPTTIRASFRGFITSHQLGLGSYPLPFPGSEHSLPDVFPRVVEKAWISGGCSALQLKALSLSSLL